MLSDDDHFEEGMTVLMYSKFLLRLDNKTTTSTHISLVILFIYFVKHKYSYHGQVHMDKSSEIKIAR